MRGVVLLPDRNVKRADYTGAFHPEAKWFRYEHNLPKDAVVEIAIDNPPALMREAVCDAIYQQYKKQGRLQTVAFFCHGWKSGIQLGFELQNIKQLARVCKETCEYDVVVPLYACSTARDEDRKVADDMDPNNTVGGDGGFADELRDALCAIAYHIYNRVVGHVTAGHSTYNPWVRFFDGAGLPYGGSGGYWVIRPKGPLWKPWIKWLREQDEKQKDRDNQFKFPFMKPDHIRAAVLGFCRDKTEKDMEI